MNASWIFPFIVLGGALQTCGAAMNALLFHSLENKWLANAVYSAPPRYAIDYKNAIGAWPEKHILGTQLGPSENGRHWPSRRQRVAVGR
jgi:hypothetical protein